MYTDSDVQEQSRENFYLSTFGVLKKINLLRDITHHSNKPNFKYEKCQILSLKTCLLLQTVTTTPGLKSIEEKKVKKQQGLPILQILNLQDSVIWKTL